MPCLQQEKGSSFEFFSLLRRDQLWESFLWQSGRLPTRKRGTVLFLLRVKELNMACMRETYYLRSCMVSLPSYTKCDMWPGRELSRSRKNWNYSRLSPKGHLYKTDTSVKRTLKVGPCLCFSLYLTLYKTDTSLRRTLSAGPKGVRLRESWLYLCHCVKYNVCASGSWCRNSRYLDIETWKKTFILSS